jgi:hypothetical protein
MKDALRTCKDTMGAVDSCIAQIEKVLARFGVTREAYHGGDFNVVSICALVRHIVEIVPEVRAIVMR